MRGPIAAVLEDSLAPRLQSDAHPHIYHPVPPALGDVKLTISDTTNAVVRPKVDTVAGTGGVEAVVWVGPNAYLKLDFNFLHRTVTEYVLAHRHVYGGIVKMHRTADVNFSDPNANKPLHVGHLRNNFLGMAVSGLLGATGYRVRRSEFISDWGIHICHAVVAHRRWGGASTPATAGVRGDRFVGAFYARFHAENAALKSGRAKRSIEPGDADGVQTDIRTELEREAAQLLGRMEAGDCAAAREVLRAAAWAEEGIGCTYRRIGTRFDVVIRESEVLDLGREMVERALVAGHCARRPDGSVYIDLDDLNMGELTFLRQDGTQTVYTRGCAVMIPRGEAGNTDRMVDLLGHHWKARYDAALRALSIFGYEWAGRVEPLYFGMVRTPEGKVSSREGTALLADAVIDDLMTRLSSHGLEAAELLAIGLLKYHFLSIRADRDIVFDPTDVWRRSLPKFALVVRTITALSTAELADYGVAAEKNGPALRRLLLHLDALPGVVERSAARLDTTALTHYINVCCQCVDACARDGIDPATAGAVGVILQRALGILNIRVPDQSDRLGPPFASAGGTGRGGQSQSHHPTEES
ncbi:arginine--tRNA ligase domain-containing protein, partial [Rhodococcus sp. T7]